MIEILKLLRLVMEYIGDYLKSARMFIFIWVPFALFGVGWCIGRKKNKELDKEFFNMKEFYWKVNRNSESEKIGKIIGLSSSIESCKNSILFLFLDQTKSTIIFEPDGAFYNEYSELKKKLSESKTHQLFIILIPLVDYKLEKPEVSLQENLNIISKQFEERIKFIELNHNDFREISSGKIPKCLEIGLKNQETPKNNIIIKK